MRTVMDALEGAAHQFGGRPALGHKENGTWRTIAWSEYRRVVRRFAKALIHLEVPSQSGVSIIGFNRPEWFIADIGAIYAGVVPAGIYTTNSPEQCQYIAEHSESQVVVVENAEQLDKFIQVRAQLPAVKAFVLMEGKSDEDGVYTWDAFLALGDDVDEAALEERIAAQSADDLCTLIYTSGTTGNPKAVMITHDNLTFIAQAMVDQIDQEPDDALITYLPLSHIAEQFVSMHAPMLTGACVYFAESIEAIGDNLREVRPALFFGPPRVWEKIQAKIVSAAAGNSPLKKKIAVWAKGVGLKGGYADQRGESKPLAYALANKLVFSKVREKLGLDRCRLVVSSTAPIARDTLEFFLSLGVPICEVYGMSECTGPATTSLPIPGQYRLGTVGKVIPGTEMKIAKDGEICMRGRHVFKGYYKNEEATQAALDEDGWLHSGDIGVMDDQGFFKITDRKKDIIITAGGENIAPQLIEGMLKAIPAVSQAVVIGDRRKYLSALITLDPERIDNELKVAGSGASNPAAAAECDDFLKYLDGQVQEINKHLARVQTIKRFRVLPRELTIEDGELTPTMKIKRRVVNEHFANEIEALYG
jgi:long-subunit acyl-CoA synthetase (AMP-forming)